ncbi:hypothetical protein J1614_004318 [Plenodomus biglobosus]|nr:hypothetical protein J1614_004318 [Plenodomus biglobosus]
MKSCESPAGHLGGDELVLKDLIAENLQCLARNVENDDWEEGRDHCLRFITRSKDDSHVLLISRKSSNWRFTVLYDNWSTGSGLCAPHICGILFLEVPGYEFGSTKGKLAIGTWVV